MDSLRGRASVGEFISVGDLVNQRLSADDRWNLALVQRDEVWGELRMRHLVDSLLAGYPIGAILLSQLRPGSNSDARELVTHADGSRVEQAAPPESWQVLDGQQRINAFVCVFTDQGRYGRFYLDMLAKRPEPTPSQGRNAKARSLPHIKHVEPDGEVFDGREGWIDLSQWKEWANARPDLVKLLVDADNVAQLLFTLDSNFSAQMTGEAAELAAENLKRLIHAWDEHTVPILRVQLDSALDVLEVFSRINLGGVNVAGEDVYFAGVKTYWRDADARMNTVLAAAPVLPSRIAALRLMSRLASRGVGHGDILPMTVERLSGARGALLRAALVELTEPNSDSIRRLSAFTQWYVHNSRLGYALRQVTPELWDEVLAWVATSQREDTDWYESNRVKLDTYLLGATMFGYRSVMGDSFRRLALVEALQAGSKGKKFPLKQILSAARGKTELRGSRGRGVVGLDNADGRESLARRNGWILTAIAQRIPYKWEAEDDFDWDHIFPQAQAYRMWSPGSGSRKKHHKDRHLVNSTGNYWALKKSANRSLQDTVGRKKFDLLREWALGNSGWSVWEEGRWSLTEEEIEGFITVDTLLDNPESINEAMRVFHETTSGRSLRLLDEALDEFPELRLFGGDGLDKTDASSPSADYMAALSIQSSDPLLTAFDEADARRTLRERSAKLADAIGNRLTKEQNLKSSWTADRKKSQLTRCWIAFELSSGNCVELMPRWEAGQGARFEVKAYANKERPGHLYRDFDHIEFGSIWSATDDEVIERFVKVVARVDQLYPR